MMSFLGENQGNGKRDVHQKFDGGSDPKTTGSHLPDEDFSFVSWISHGVRFKV